MAYSFDGSNDQITYSFSAITGYPFTMSGWSNPANATHEGTVLWMGNLSTDNRYFFLELDGTSAGDPLRAVARNTNFLAGITANSFTANAWNHVCGVFSANNSRTGYLNGDTANKGTNTSTDAAAFPSIEAVTVGVNDRPNVDKLNGRAAEAAIWNVELTEAEIVSLSKGYSPLFIRPEALVFYAPLVRSAIDVIGGISPTITEAVVADHPRMFYPAPMPGRRFTTAAGGSNYNQSAAGTMGTLSATLVLKTGKALSGVSGSYSATLARLTGKALTGTNGSSSAELAKSTTKSFAGTIGDLSATLSAIKTALVAVSGAVGDLTGSIARQVNKALVGVSGSVSGTLVKLTSKAFSGADGGLSGALNASAGKFVELAGVAGDLAGTLAKQTLKSLSGATDTVSGAISKQINKALSGASGSVSGTLSSSVYKVVELAGAAGNLTGTLTRSIAKSLAGTAGSISGSIAKAISKSFSGTMGALSGSFTTFAPTEYLQSITGSISSITGSVTMTMVFRRAKMKAGYAIRSIINGGRRLTD